MKSLQQIQERQRATGYSESQVLRWFETDPGESHQPDAGVFLVIHGLNLKSEKLESYGRVIRQLGYHVLLVTLRGHGGNTQEFKQVKSTDWQTDLMDAYSVASVRAGAFANQKINLLTFSTGGAVAALFQLKAASTINFDKVIHISPAFKLGRLANLVRWLTPFKFLSLVSLNSKEYRAHAFTPIAAYNALLKTIDELNINIAHSADQLNRPTLVIADPKDELIDVGFVSKLVSTWALKSWKLQLVDATANSKKIAAPHHSLIDENLVGPAEWNKITTAISTFLK